MAHRNELSGVEQKIETHDDHKILNSARKLWEESDRKVRHEMAEYLKCMSPEFSCDTIHKKLSSFVAKHERVRDIAIKETLLARQC